MKKPVLTKDGDFDMDAEWECEHCKRKVRFGDTALSWCLNIICEDCADKESKVARQRTFRNSSQSFQSPQMITHYKPKPKTRSSTETVVFTQALQKAGLHYSCVSKATIELLFEIQAEPLPMAKKVKGERNIKIVVADFEAGIYRVTWQGESYINQLREAGLV